MFKAIKKTLHRWMVEGRAYNISKIRERRMLIEFHEAWKEENKDFIRKCDKETERETERKYNKTYNDDYHYTNESLISDSFHNLTGNL